ncbi:Nn.00g102360.m01.CDS01 [Neocucurbitaria sp. VM-36]
MVEKWSHLQEWKPERQRQRDEELARAARAQAEIENYEHFWQSVGDQPLPGHYRNLRGSHFEVTYNGDAMQVNCVAVAIAQGSPGEEWLPWFPEGTSGDLYAWNCPPESQWCHVPVILVPVGADDVRYAWSRKFGTPLWVKQNRPALLAGDNGALFYGPPVGPCEYDSSRTCYVNLSGNWERMTSEMVTDLGIEYFPGPEPEPEAPYPLLLDAEAQMPAEEQGSFQIEEMARQPSVPGAVDQNGTMNFDDVSNSLPSQQQLFQDQGPANSEFALDESSGFDGSWLTKALQDLEASNRQLDEAFLAFS